jgi:hypothetical protein
MPAAAALGLALGLVALASGPVQQQHDAADCPAQQAPGKCFADGRLLLQTTTNFPAQGCCAECRSYPGCVAWTYNAGPKALDAAQVGLTKGCLLYGNNGTLGACPEGVGSAVASGWLTAAPPPLPPPPPPTAPPHGAPNVLFIAVDDLRPQTGAYGHNDTITPHLDAFAASSLLFTNAHAQIAHCSPSRNSLMSGRTPDHIKVWNFIDDLRDPTTGGNEIVTMPEYFRQHGFFATGSGKVFHPAKPPNFDQVYTLHSDQSPALSSFPAGNIPPLPRQTRLIAETRR